MRFMIIVRAAAGSAGPAAVATLAARLADFRAGLEQAGALLDAALPAPDAAGWRICHAAGRRRPIVTSAGRSPPAGCVLIQARSDAAALEWAQRFPGDDGDAAEIEIFRLRSPGD